MTGFRVGHGYDAHRFADGRPLILGGVTIPHPKGLQGHSDADVLTHAICDAILGALGLGDIGRHFPDSDSKYLGIPSLELLGRINEMAKKIGWQMGNVDATVIAQSPRLMPYIPKMIENISGTLGVDASSVSVKATTTEGMGFVGEEKGIAAHAVVLMTQHAP